MPEAINNMLHFIQKYFRALFVAAVLINFLLRILIYFKTNLFAIGDFKVHLKAIEDIANGNGQALASGNFLFAISYIGYFCKYFLGSLDYFFIINSLLGTTATALISGVVFFVTAQKPASLLTLAILTIYSEFMVFSSVFYSSVIMIFLLVTLIIFLFRYYASHPIKNYISFGFLTGLLIAVSFFFKQELIFLPLFLIIMALVLRKEKLFLKKTIALSAIILGSTLLFYSSGLLTRSGNEMLANDFIFFGHTDYGGNGGEGAFVYPENKARFETALAEYCKTNNIIKPTRKDYNSFQKNEVVKFITQHPFEWIKLQFGKFFRTFGIVPETISFKVLYTGLLKGKLWLTSVIVVAPVAVIIILFILFFNLTAIKHLIGLRASGIALRSRKAEDGVGLQADKDKKNRTSRQSPVAGNPIKFFLYVYLMLFIYYLIATIFFGQYQERYRMPLMVVFIIPALGFFIASFNKEQFFKRSSLIIKSFIIVLFLTIWTFQAKKAISNKQRFQNAIESVESQIGK